MSYPEKYYELIKYQNNLQDEADEISQQLEKSKQKRFNGDPINHEWFGRASFALKKKNREIDEIKRQISIIRKEVNKIQTRKENDYYGRNFIQCSRQLLDEKTYLMIMKAAKEQAEEVNTEQTEDDDDKFNR